MSQNCTFMEDFNVIGVYYYLEKIQCYLHVFYFYATHLITRQGVFQLESWDEYLASSRKHFAIIPHKVGVSIGPICPHIVHSFSI